MDFNFDFQFDRNVIGVDEVGRGSWAGPVMAGAALLNYQMPIDKRLNDSKKLTPKIRKEILENLTKNNIFGIGEVSNHEIDKIGILKATFKAMEMAGTPCPYNGKIGKEASAEWAKNQSKRPDAKDKEQN